MENVAINSIERETLSFEEWVGVDAWRYVEFCAFQLAMHILVSVSAWQIVESRWTGAQADWNAYRLAVRRIYTIYCHFASRRRGLPRTVHVDLTARALDLTPRQVYDALADAALMGVPDLMATAG